MIQKFSTFLVMMSLTAAAPAAVVVTSFPKGSYPFYSGISDGATVNIPLPAGASAELNLHQGGYVGLLETSGDIRVAITSSPPPNIGGLIHAYRDGDILGVSLPPGTSWIRGEQVSDDPAIFTNYLYNVQFPPTPIGEFTGGIAYIGLEFAISGELHYGWLKVQLFEEDVTGSFYRPFANQILAFAYEDEAGVPIVAGVPEPVSLTLVSVVLPLLVARRRRRGSL